MVDVVSTVVLTVGIRSIGHRSQLPTEESLQRDAIMGEKASRIPGSQTRRGDLINRCIGNMTIAIVVLTRHAVDRMPGSQRHLEDAAIVSDAMAGTEDAP